MYFPILGNGEIVYTDIEGQLSIMSNCSRLQRIHNADENKEGKVDENGFAENEVDFGDYIDEDEKNEDDDLTSVKDLDQLMSPDPELKDSSERGNLQNYQIADTQKNNNIYSPTKIMHILCFKINT